MHRLKKENQEVIVDDCKTLFQNAEKTIAGIIVHTTNRFKDASKAAEKIVLKNLILNFVCSIVLVAGTIAGYLYVQNYRDGTKIAEAKAVEALEEERTKLENEFDLKKKEIETAAVKAYKNSNDFVIDGATYVANNFYQLRILETFYLEMPIEQKKKLGLHNWLIECHKEYRQKYGKKTPREL